MAATLVELTVAGLADRWRKCGFEVEGDECGVGTVVIRFVPEAEGGLIGWALRDLRGTDLDGLPTRRADAAPGAPAGPHPNGVTRLDHVVAISPDLDRTIAALQGAGLDLRRVREEPTPAGAPRQAFFRLGEAILEVVQEPPEATVRAGGDRPAFFWGLAFEAPDLDASVALLGEDVGDPRPAVQPGRRIATLRRSAGLALPVALITPPPA